MPRAGKKTEGRGERAKAPSETNTDIEHRTPNSNEKQFPC